MAPSFSPVSKSVLGIACLQAAIVIFLEAYCFLPFVSQSTNPAGQKILVYLACFILTMIFQIYLCFDATRNQNTIEVFAFVILNFGSFAYSVLFAARREQESEGIVDVVIGKERFQYISIAVCAIVFLVTVIFSYLASKLFREFGWKIYKKIGADPKMRDMYRAYHYYLMLLKLDFLFFLTFSIQLAVLILQSNDVEKILTFLAVGVIPILLGVAVLGLRRESKSLMSIVFFGFLAGMCYFVFKLYRMYTQKREAYSGNIRYMTFLGVCSLILTILSIILTVVCCNNFNKGLKQHVNTSTSKNPQEPNTTNRKPQSFILD